MLLSDLFEELSIAPGLGPGGHHSMERLRSMLVTLSDQELVQLVSRRPYMIRYISDPSEKVQMAAIAADRSTAALIRNPAPAVSRSIGAGPEPRSVDLRV